MTNLATLIDSLPAPQIPNHFSEQERQLVQLALESAKQQIRPYDGDFKAPWLLSDYKEPVWETINRGREELVDGKWQNTIRIDWRIQLPNFALFTDARYNLLLTTIKLIAFLTRSDFVSGASAPIAWKLMVNRILLIVRWVVLHENRFMPEQYSLKLLDQPALDWLFRLVAEGGWAHALQIPQRILIAMYQGAHCVSCPQALLDNTCAIPAAEVVPLVKWLEAQDGYKRVLSGAYQGKRNVNRGFLAKMIGEERYSLNTPNVARFLRQFEPDFGNESLLVSSKQDTEFPSQKNELIQDVSGTVSEKTIEGMACSMATILDAHHHIPDLLPEPALLSLRRATSIAKSVARPESHTLFMPVNTGLAYLNEAMRFVEVYGEAVIDSYLAIIAEYRPKARNARPNKFLNRRLNDWSIATGEPITNILNITEFRSQEGNTDFDRFRSNPTLDEALRVLIGSCIVCMAILKPSREEELTHLKRNCLREDGGGYWLNFNLGKSNAGGAWQDEDRPIPVISAKAIHLLQRLGESLTVLFAEDRKIGDNLFYLPKLTGMGALAASGTLLKKHLNIFCDYVGLPPDAEGRRWYARIHEMRKWFLLLLFWSGRFDVLDAARWIAGHTDAEHIYAYIEKEFPGEELPQIEAEYSIDRIYRREQERKRGKGDAGNEDGVDALYEVVLRHFNVESLTMVPEPEWTGYVESLRKEEKFHLEPHSIYGGNGRDVVGINVSFVMREVP